MSLCETPLYEQLLSNVEIPKFYAIRQNIPDTAIKDIPAAMYESGRTSGSLELIKPGERVALAVGSREYSHMVEIVKTVVEMVKSRGAEPFIVPAMGSHAGANAEGQKGLLEKLGISLETVGAPIVSSMETVVVGKTEHGLDARIDKNAFNADKIIPINRIKAHTDFEGPYESGMMKMLAIGLGKQEGADVCHRMGFKCMSQNVLEIGKAIIATGKIAFFVALMENEAHKIFHIELVPADQAEAKEPPLLKLSKAHLPRIPFNEVDLIMIDRFGKDFSGAGADPHVTGRSSQLGVFKPFAQRIITFDLTDKSYGNASGMGMVDAVPMRFYKKINFDNTYPNGITAAEITGDRMPVIMPNDSLTIRIAIKCCVANDRPLRVVHFRDTYSLVDIKISEGLLEEALANPHLVVDKQPLELAFDGEGNIEGYKNA